MNESRERIRRERERERNTYTSPRLALRRVLILSEGRQFREAAALLQRLGPSVLQGVASELPIDLLAESLPHSAHLLETLFNRLSNVEVVPRPDVQPELVAWRLVRLFSRQQDPGLRQRCGGLAHSLSHWHPPLRDLLMARRRELDKAVQGLGTHGLTADSTGELISLHVALKNELQRHIDAYKTAVHKLDELSNVTLNQDPASSSHQRLLATTRGDIQKRLIDNKTLLTLIDKPALTQLQPLIAQLANRVQHDKEVLLQVGQIKRLDPTVENVDERAAAGLLMSFSRGCGAVLALLPPTAAPPASPPALSCCSDGYHSDPDASSGNENDSTRSELVTRYGQLFNKSRVDTLDALDALPPLQHAHHLKGKILFSVIVLAFRACQNLRDRKTMETRKNLGLPDNFKSPTLIQLEAAVRSALSESVETFPLGEAERQVANQVLSTLHEYPCLERCGGLLQYVSDCCRLAWILCNQIPPLTIDTDFTPVLMRADKHVRFHSSDQRSDLIKSFVWPALMDEENCVFKAVVMT
ncbi:uncharacterized protein LOC143915593 [Arctopsyche grandis]|uniref:uncharacterized protein LOC143915593 n=1 Tax=Arctopsyche grandis TaxID=121162 RepID=UPI00406D701B